MVVVETPVFTRQICELLPDDEYRRLQLALVLRPEQGALVPKGQGLRELRWGQPAEANAVAYESSTTGTRRLKTAYLLFAYEKSKQADLTPEQARALGRLIREELK